LYIFKQSKLVFSTASQTNRQGIRLKIVVLPEIKVQAGCNTAVFCSFLRASLSTGGPDLSAAEGDTALFDV